MENSRVDPSFLVYAETEIAVRAGMKNACLGEKWQRENKPQSLSIPCVGRQASVAFVDKATTSLSLSCFLRK